MRYTVLPFVILCVIIACSADTPKEEVAKYLLQTEVFPGVTDSDALDVAEELIEAYDNYTESSEVMSPFPCSPTGRSSPRPTNARNLLPGDVDVIMAAGGSTTAGFGAKAKSLFDIIREWRGYAFSIGGTAPITTDGATLPKILQVYNPDLTGYATGEGYIISPKARLDVAWTGAQARDLSKQITLLIKKLRSDSSYGDINTTWKVLTIFIGTRDLCLSCKNTTYFSADNYYAAIEAGLDLVLQNIPQVFVNLVPPPDVSQIQLLTKGFACKHLHPLECPCYKDPNVVSLQQQYAEQLQILVAQPKYQVPGFYAAVQPFTQDSTIPLKADGTPDYSYFAPDCFHLSEKGQLTAGKALWNNMQQFEKQTTWAPGSTFYECPGAGQFLQ